MNTGSMLCQLINLVRIFLTAHHSSSSWRGVLDSSSRRGGTFDGRITLMTSSWWSSCCSCLHKLRCCVLTQQALVPSGCLPRLAQCSHEGCASSFFLLRGRGALSWPSARVTHALGSLCEGLRPVRFVLDIGGWGCGLDGPCRLREIARSLQQNCTAIQRNWSSCTVFRSISALSRRILMMKKGGSTIHFNGDSMNTELLFPNNSFCNSAQYLRSSGELVSSIRLDRGRKGTSQLLREQQDVDKFTTDRSGTLGISSDTGSWNQDARKRFELRSAGQWNTAHTIV